MLWEVEVLEDLYEDLERLNLTWLKLRILRLMMNRKSCCNCTYKLVLVSTNESQCWECLCCVYLYCLKKHEKKRI